MSAPGYPGPQIGYPTAQTGGQQLPLYPTVQQPGQPAGYYNQPSYPNPHYSQGQRPQDVQGAVVANGPVPVGVPPGLEYLTQIDQILIHQKVELIEAFIGFETNNKYVIKNSMGQKIFSAKEKNDCCTRNCCGSLRSFHIKIKDNSDREVIHLVRPYRCACCWCPCCLQKLEVQSPPGTVIGYVIQNWHPCKPKFSVQNASKDTVLKITGPCLSCNCCSDVIFKVTDAEESKTVGQIRKQWSGLLKEAFTDADNFGIQFPMDLDVKIKAVLMGACFLIDFMFFEKVGDEKQRNTVFS
ncbi:phospholipid scramblase 1-like [Protopterus annectens]|uniref:phospholipid scramblase 1-like n=1 Tax=Protopterus annectens TaxID=7888 RepID=UPI001CF9B11F|nr:phospholipid scramblase 1-like [Protopterus annectens]